MRTSRREAIALISGVSLGAAVGRRIFKWGSPQNEYNSELSPAISRLLILAVGGDGRTHAKWRGAEAGSVFTIIEPGRNAIQSHFLPIEKGHSVKPIGNDSFLLISRDTNVSAIARFPQGEITSILAPEGYLFSGHGVIESKKKTALLTVKHAVVKSIADRGLLQRVDLTTGKTLGTFDSGGVEPHEICYIGAQGYMVVSHYGSLYQKLTGDQLYYDDQGAKLVVLAADSLEAVRDIPTVGHGALTHITTDRNGDVYAVPLQFGALSGLGRRRLTSALNSANFNLSPLDLEEEKIGFPSPIIHIEPTSGRVEVHSQLVEFQRRAQSIACHTQSNSIFATYPNSAHLVRYSPLQNRLTKCSETELGINNIRGVCDIPGTPFIAISGYYQGLAVVNAESFKVERKFDVPLHTCSHIFAIDKVDYA